MYIEAMVDPRPKMRIMALKCVLFADYERGCCCGQGPTDAAAEAGVACEMAPSAIVVRNPLQGHAAACVIVGSNANMNAAAARRYASCQW